MPLKPASAIPSPSTTELSFKTFPISTDAESLNQLFFNHYSALISKHLILAVTVEHPLELLLE